MEAMEIILGWIVCGAFAYGTTLYYFTRKWPQFRHMDISVFTGVCGPIGLLVSIFFSLASWNVGFKFKPHSRQERWNASQEKYPGLGYEYFIKYDGRR